MENVKSNRVTCLTLKDNQYNLESKLNSLGTRMDQIIREMKISNETISKLRITKNLTVALEKKNSKETIPP